jgi:hypothetical protein
VGECKLVENSMEAPQKAKNRTVTWFSNTTTGDTQKECKSSYNKGTCAPMFFAALFTIIKVWKQSGYPTTDEWD